MHCWRQNIHHAFSMLGLSLVTLGFMVGCTTPQATSTTETAQTDTEEVVEVEAGNDPEIQVAESEGLQDCVEHRHSARETS